MQPVSTRSNSLIGWWLPNIKMLLIFALTCLFCVSAGSENVFSMPLVRQKSPRRAAFEAYHSNNIAAQWEYKPKPSPNITNVTAALYRYIDSEYYTVVLIGKKARPFNMALDTSWGYSWVMSDDCPYTTVGCWFHNKYDHSQSSTYKPNGSEVIFKMGKDVYSGYLSTDVFHVEKASVNQTFIEMIKVPPLFILNKIDGIIGLGYSSISDGIPPLFYNIIKQYKLKRRLFTIYMSRDKNSNRGGAIQFGAIEERHILQNETILYVPIMQTGYWQFRMDKVFLRVSSKNITYNFCNGGCQVIIDSSTNAIYAPEAEVNKINRIVGAKYVAYGRYKVRCDTIDILPELNFVIGNKNFTLKGRDYVEQMSYDSITVCLTAFLPTSEYDKNMWVLGGAFLAEFYTIYDLDNNQIGIVKAA